MDDPNPLYETAKFPSKDLIQESYNPKPHRIPSPPPPPPEQSHGPDSGSPTPSNPNNTEEQ